MHSCFVTHKNQYLFVKSTFESIVLKCVIKTNFTNFEVWATKHPLVHHPQNPILGLFGWDETEPHGPMLVGEFLFLFSHAPLIATLSPNPLPSYLANPFTLTFIHVLFFSSFSCFLCFSSFFPWDFVFLTSFFFIWKVVFLIFLLFLLKGCFIVFFFFFLKACFLSLFSSWFFFLFLFFGFYFF